MVGFIVFKNATRNPQLFLKFTFIVDGVGEGMEKAGSLFVGLPLVYVDYSLIF